MEDLGAGACRAAWALRAATTRRTSTAGGDVVVSMLCPENENRDFIRRPFIEVEKGSIYSN